MKVVKTSKIITGIVITGLILSIWPWGAPLARAQELIPPGDQPRETTSPPSGFFALEIVQAGYDKGHGAGQILWDITISNQKYSFVDARFEVEIEDIGKVSEFKKNTSGKTIFETIISTRNQNYGFDGRPTPSRPDRSAKFGIFSDQLLTLSKNNKAQFVLIDRVTPSTDGILKYTIKSAYHVSPLDGTAQFYQGPTVTGTINYRQDSGVIGEPDANWYKDNLFYSDPVDGVIKRLSIDCSVSPPKVVLKSGGQRTEDIVFQLRKVIFIRGLDIDRNRFYFIDGKKAPNLGIVISDQLSRVASGGYSSESLYIADIGKIEDYSDDKEIPGIKLLIDESILTSFEKCILNKYYNKYDPSTDKYIPGSAGKGETDYKAGDRLIYSGAISQEALKKDGIDVGETSLINVGGAKPIDKEDPCKNFGSVNILGIWKLPTLGKALCEVGFAFAGIAAIIAGWTFNLLLSAAQLQ